MRCNTCENDYADDELNYDSPYEGPICAECEHEANVDHAEAWKDLD